MILKQQYRGQTTDSGDNTRDFIVACASEQVISKMSEEKRMSMPDASRGAPSAKPSERPKWKDNMRKETYLDREAEIVESAQWL
jgi:hypothetical protein